MAEEAEEGEAEDDGGSLRGDSGGEEDGEREVSSRGAGDAGCCESSSLSSVVISCKCRCRDMIEVV